MSESERRAIAVSYVNTDGDRVGGQRYNDLLPPTAKLPADQDTQLSRNLINYYGLDREPTPQILAVLDLQGGCLVN